MRLLGILLLALLVLAACEGDPTPTVDLDTIDPLTVAEMGDVYKANPARGEVQFEHSAVYIEDVVNTFHSDKNEAFLGARRDRTSYGTLRLHAPVETLAQMDVGDRVLFRCDKLELDKRTVGLSLSTRYEFVCKEGQVLRIG